MPLTRLTRTKMKMKKKCTTRLALIENTLLTHLNIQSHLNRHNIRGCLPASIIYIYTLSLSRIQQTSDNNTAKLFMMKRDDAKRSILQAPRATLSRINSQQRQHIYKMHNNSYIYAQKEIIALCLLASVKLKQGPASIIPTHSGLVCLFVIMQLATEL